MENMIIFSHQIYDESKKYLVGGKAIGLWKFNDLNTPKWFVITSQCFEEIYQEDLTKINELVINEDYIALEQLIMLKKIPDNITNAILKKISKEKLYAIRSSAIDEDQRQNSFAGIMSSFMNVNYDTLITYVKRCYLSAFLQPAVHYRKANNLSIMNIKMAVIVQEMIDSEISGVANTINPITNNPDEFLISVVKGLGEALVSGQVPSIDYYVNGDAIRSEDLKNPEPLLNSKLIKKIMKLCYKVLARCNTFQDIEFAISNNKVYFLQSRTIVPYQHIDITLPRTIYDNANIIESYSGVTTPLTFTFAREVYEKVYTQVLKAGKVNQRVIDDLKPYLADMLRFYDNKIYYNLNSWYKLTSIFPNSKNNLNYMEKMMGVKTKMTKVKKIKMSFGDLIRLGIILFDRFNKMPKLSKAFLEQFELTVTPYLGKDFKGVNSHELLQIYQNIEENILDDFTTPIVNDVGAMMYYGRLTKYVHKLKIPDPDGFISNVISKQGGVESTGSAVLYQKIVTVINENIEIKNDFIDLVPEALYQKYHTDSLLSDFIKTYIDKFGSRVMDELKLETETLYENPLYLYEMLQNSIQNNLEISSFPTTEISLSFLSFLKRWRLKSLIKKTKYFIKNRESLRLRRTYLYSVIRRIFLRIGENFVEQRYIDLPRDIFFLKKKEIMTIINGQISQLKDVRELIISRKEMINRHKEKPSYDRMVFYGDEMLPILNAQIEEGVLSGIPSGAGVVEGYVKLVTDPKTSIINNEIMLAERTDPGWIMLFPMCKGIIVERGSILSHSAVVAREMGIPAVVGVKDATKLIRDGVYVKLDGIKGEVKIYE